MLNLEPAPSLYGCIPDKINYEVNWWVNIMGQQCANWQVLVNILPPVRKKPHEMTDHVKIYF